MRGESGCDTDQATIQITKADTRLECVDKPGIDV